METYSEDTTNKRAVQKSPHISLDNAISSEEIGTYQGKNENSPRNREIKLRKNEMKVRKKDFEVPKNFFVSPWTFQDLYGGISRFPSPPDFFSPKSHFALPKNQKNIHEDMGISPWILGFIGIECRL